MTEHRKTADVRSIAHRHRNFDLVLLVHSSISDVHSDRAPDRRPPLACGLHGGLIRFSPHSTLTTPRPPPHIDELRRLALAACPLSVSLLQRALARFDLKVAFRAKRHLQVMV